MIVPWLSVLLLLLASYHSWGIRDSGEERLPRLSTPTSAMDAMLAKRDSAQSYKSQLVQDRAHQIAAQLNHGRPKGAKVRVIHQIEVWRCCPSEWFQSRRDEPSNDVMFIRQYRTGSATLRDVLWRWAQHRQIDIETHDIHFNLTKQHLRPTYKETTPIRRYIDSRLSVEDFRKIKYNWLARASILPDNEPMLITLLRDPLERSLALFYWAHSRPESMQTAKTSPRIWRRENKGFFSKEHMEHCNVFAEQSEWQTPKIYTIVPQWSLYGESAEEGALVLRNLHVMIGFTDKLEEFLIMLRRRLGLPSIKEVVYLSTNHYRHPSVSDWPLPVVNKLNSSSPLVSDYIFINKAKEQYHEQRRTFGSDRMLKELTSFQHILDDARGVCDLRDLENRGLREFMPPCSRSCEGHSRLLKCFMKRFDEKHSATAIRSAANKLREIGGVQAAPHTPLVV